MPRDSYFQSTGNPLQVDRLPATRPRLQFPLRSAAAGDAAFTALALLGLTLLAVAVVVTRALVSSAAANTPGDLLLRNVLPLAFGCFLLGRAIRAQNVRRLATPLACLVLATVHLNAPLSAPLQWLTASAAVGLLVWSLGRHWTFLCTATPFDPASAARLRAKWNGHLLVAAAVPFVIACLAVTTGFFTLTVTTSASVLAGCVLQGAFKGSVLRALADAVVSWFAYNRRDWTAPGLFLSPAGSTSRRLLLTGTAVFLSASSLASVPLPEGGRSLRTSATLGRDVVVSFFLPAALCLASAVLGLPALVEAGHHRRDAVAPLDWSQLVTIIQRSDDPIERDSIYLGRVVGDSSPLLVPETVYSGHAHVLGDSGAGKTSRGLVPPIEQLGRRGDKSIIVVDLKADTRELFAALYAASDHVRRRTGTPLPVKFFTNDQSLPTYAFNPLTQRYWRKLGAYQRTDILCGSLGLLYGAKYGESYFTSANTTTVHHALKAHPEVASLAELGERMRYELAHAKPREISTDIKQAAGHVQSVLDRLASFPALNVTADQAAAIDLDEAFREPQLLYFHLSSMRGPSSSPEMARLVVYSLLAAAATTKRQVPVFLVIDEFQRMATKNLDYLLQLARSLDIGVILANQSMQDLDELIHTVETNCRFRQWFAVSGKEDQDRLLEQSGQTIELLYGQSETRTPEGTTTTRQCQQHFVPRLSRNDILLASDHPKRSIVKITRGAGYAQYGGFPFIIESDYHITETEYARRKAMPWPDGVPGTFVPDRAAASALPPSKPGPTLTTEIIGDSPVDPADPADPFRSYFDAKADEERRSEEEGETP